MRRGRRRTEVRLAGWIGRTSEAKARLLGGWVARLKPCPSQNHPQPKHPQAKSSHPETIAILCAVARVLITVTPITSVLFLWHGCALSGCRSVGIVPIESDVPPSRNQPIRFGGKYAAHAFVLRGGGICGGTLDFPARGTASSGPGFTVSIVGPSVDVGPSVNSGRGPGARPLRLPFRLARPPRFLTEMAR